MGVCVPYAPLYALFVASTLSYHCIQTGCGCAQAAQPTTFSGGPYILQRSENSVSSLIVFIGFAVLSLAIVVEVVAISDVTSRVNEIEKWITWQETGDWFATYYGHDDAASGRHTSAYWQGVQCLDFLGYPVPPVVTESSNGCAAPRWVPLCTHLQVCNEHTCDICTVVDRQRLDTIAGLSHVDLQYNVAEKIIPRGTGVVTVKILKETGLENE